SGDSSRLRLLLRKLRLRERGGGGRTGLHRPVARGDPQDGRQGRSAQGDGGGRSACCAGLAGNACGRGRSARSRGEDWLSDYAQGGGWRRRQGFALRRERVRAALG